MLNYVTLNEYRLILSFAFIDELPSAVGDENVSWLPYFAICVSIAILVATLTVLTRLSFCCQKRKNIDEFKVWITTFLDLTS